MDITFDDITQADDEWKPQRIIAYSPEGLGKTTLGATFEKPILARTEDGAGNIAIKTFPILKKFDDLVSVIKLLHGEHPYRTLIIDTLDWLEPLIWAKLMQEKPVNDNGQPVTHIEDYGYGKGYAMADEWWVHIMSGLDSLRNKKGMTIVLLSHAEIKNHTPPESDPYDRYQLKVHKRASALWREWADIFVFMNFKTSIAKANVGFNKEVKRGTGTGERVIFTEERPAYKAKNRWGLPPEIYIGQDKTWAGFHQALNNATNGRYELPGGQNNGN